VQPGWCPTRSCRCLPLAEPFRLRCLQENARRRGNSRLYLPDLVQQGANMVMVQFDVALPAALDLVFLSAPGEPQQRDERLQQLSGAAGHA
jgi:hypothetical protein